MALSNTGSLSNLPGLPAAYTSAQMQQAIDAAASCVEGYCHRKFEQTTYTDYLDGNGLQVLPVRQRPVLSITSVNMDPAGFYGKGVGAFNAQTLLTEGRDWVLKYSGGGNVTSKSGLLVRLGGGISGTTLDAIWPWEWRKGTLTVRMPPVWPPGIGNVKVVYSAGYATVPADVTSAVNQVAAWLLRSGYYGGRILSSESLSGYSYGLSALAQRPELGEARDLLSRYREAVL